MPDTTERIQVEIISFAFQDLHSEVSKNSVDMVISSMTATKKREIEFGVLFSKGYFVMHQTLLTSQLTYDRRLSLFDNIKKKRIGAMKGTTNERVAYYLADTCKCGLVVKPDYQEAHSTANGHLIELRGNLRGSKMHHVDAIWMPSQYE
jgi:ABC-type amino acid transport substrate-binding protein